MEVGDHSNSYRTLSSLQQQQQQQQAKGGDNNSGNAEPSRRLSLAAVRATTARRTNFALQVIAASKATLSATDALIAASDALLAAPTYSSVATSSSGSPGQSACQATSSYAYASAAATPEACEASDDSESSHTQYSHDVYALLQSEKPNHHQSQQQQQHQQPPQVEQQQQPPPQQPPRAKQKSPPPQQPSSQTDSGDSPVVLEAGPDVSSSSASSSGMEDSSHVESTSVGISSNAVSVDLMVTGRQSPGSFTDLPMSASLVSGSFDTKVPIPEFISSLAAAGEQQSTVTPTPSAVVASATAPAHIIEQDPKLTTMKDKDETHKQNEDEDEMDDDKADSDMDDSSSDNSGDSSYSDDSSSEEDSATAEQTPSSTASSNIVAGGYVNELLGELQQNQRAPVANIAQQQPQQRKEPQSSSLSTGDTVLGVPPSADVLSVPGPSSEVAKIPVSAPIPSMTTVVAPASTKKAPLAISPMNISDEAENDSSFENDSEDDSDSSSSSPELEEESDTGRPSISEAPSVAPSENPSDTTGRSVSSDVENDDYVQELLSELKETTEGSVPITAATLPVPQISRAIGPTENLLGAQAATVLRKPDMMSPHVLQDQDSGEEDDTEDSADCSSDEGSSEVSSSDGATGSEGEEDDEYVDELLKELHATKPSSLIPQQKLPVPAPAPAAKAVVTSIADGAPTATVMTDSSVSDDDISDIVPSSSSKCDSSDSDLFSSDEEDSDEDEDSRDVAENYISSDDATSEGGEDESYVDDLLNELQAPRAAPPKPMSSPAQPPTLPSADLPVMPPGLPMMASPLPGEGLNLANIRAELEKVGRAVMTQKSGAAFVARAQILASINQLSSHVPNCVLDFLGKEVKANLARKKEKKENPTKEPAKHKTIDVVSQDDDMSEVSALSELEISEKEEDSNVKFSVDASDVKLGGNDEGKTEDSSNVEPAAPPPSLMRQQSEEALDEMFNKAREDGSVVSGDVAIENMFNSSNEYGLTASKASRSMASSMSSSGCSDSTKLKRKSKSRCTSLATMSWGTNLEGTLPSVSRFECALLFVDISGFTKLSTLLDPETLSKVINSYFQLIVSKIYEFNGDIQKFAGDAIFAEWRCSEKDSMEFCVAAATACASQIVDECSDFPVTAGGMQRKTGEPISALNVHCALGSGQMIGIHVGDHTRRREYLFLGEPIDQLTWGADLAKHGEFVVSPEAFRSLSLAGVLDFKIRPSESEPAIIAKRGTTMFKSEKLKDYRVSRIEYAKSRGVTGHVEGLEVDELQKYQQRMALYVHPVVAAIHMDQKSQMKTKSSAIERHREEAELRRVYIMFIHPVITFSEENGYAVDLLNEIMNLTSTQLERYSGHLRQMIVDDKGLVLIGTFGLRGSTFPNMVAERALPATIALHNALQSQLGVDNRIGATFGEVYCGAVGGVKRHEYAVLGPSANLAARLMGNKNNPGILVDGNIRRMASRKYAFNALPPVKAKGYSEPVPIFEPLSPLERSWGRIQPNFVGREVEIKSLMNMARGIVVGADEPHSRLVFVASQSGMGKTTMVAHAIEHIRNTIGDNTRRLVITKQVGKESSALLPFGMFRSILLDVLSDFAASTDDKSLASGVSGFTSQSLSLHSLSCKSQGSSVALSLAKSEELLKVLCRELNTPSGFVDHVLHNLSGKTGRKPAATDKAPSMKAMVSFMSRAFRRCTQETKLVVVALDDVQYIDEMTWKVLRQVFEGCDNVLMICAFDLSRSRDLKIESTFLASLNTKYKDHFVPMELGGLGKEEITVMTMKTLGLQREEISADLLNEICIQSGGMPHFATEFLELVKRRQFTEMMDARMEGRAPSTGLKTLGPNALGSVPEIILHRIDSFDVAVRNVLNIAAVLGKSFSLKEVISVLKENHDLREDVLEKEAVAALEMAMNEGILREEEAPDEEDDDNKSEEGKVDKNKSDKTMYAFYHSVWQSTILSLMLDARKKDVHKKIALSMEKEMKKDGSDFAFQMKLLRHWKFSGNTSKLTELALDVGKHFEQNLGLPTQGIRIYEEALEAWKDDKPSDSIGGICPEMLNMVDPDELANISKLHVALGRACNGASRNADSALCYHDALRILRVPTNAGKVTDRSVAFPAYFGLYESLKANHITQEDSKRYEQLLIKKFLEDSKSQEQKYHHVHAITCQIDLFRRYGDTKKAVAVQSILYKIYDHTAHTKKLRQTYGGDEAALSFSNSAMWHWELGDKDAALDACRFVIGKLMPKMDRSDVHHAFVLMYPVVIVMKTYDVAVQARKHFNRLVVKPFSAFFGEGKSSFFLPVYEPIMMLLHLVGFPDLDKDTLEEYTDWALDRDRLCFGTLANRRLGALGRCADSLSAEICFLLAERTEEEETRRVLIEHGKEIGQEALVFNKEQGLKLAEQQMDMLLTNYRPLMAELEE